MPFPCYDGDPGRAAEDVLSKCFRAKFCRFSTFYDLQRRIEIPYIMTIWGSRREPSTESRPIGSQGSI